MSHRRAIGVLAVLAAATILFTPARTAAQTPAEPGAEDAGGGTKEPDAKKELRLKPVMASKDEVQIGSAGALQRRHPSLRPLAPRDPGGLPERGPARIYPGERGDGLVRLGRHG